MLNETTQPHQPQTKLVKDPGALSGLLVLDFGQAAVGPVSASYLGMMGATVIKVEQPNGDAVRQGQPRIGDESNGGTSSTFVGNNLTKRGIVLDLKSVEGKESVKQLVAKADVLIENFRSHKVMERLGLGYREVLAPLNPRLVYLQSSAFGPAGPWTGMYSDEWITAAVSGCVSATGPLGGLGEFTRGSAPLDWNGAMLNAAICLAALMQRERTGRGQMIQTSQFGSSIFCGLTRIAEFAASGIIPLPMGSASSWLVPDQSFLASDGWILLSTPGEKIWQSLCNAIGSPQLANDPRFASNAARVIHRVELINLLSPLFLGGSVSDWIATLRLAGVPCLASPDRATMTQAQLQHPQVRANSMLTRIEAPYGSVLTQAPHWQFEKTPTAISRPSPRFGEHTQEVLQAINAWTPYAIKQNVSQSTTKGGCIAGLRVVEIADGVSGPLAGMVLAQLGAHVQRVAIDDWLQSVGPLVNGEGAVYRMLNYGKTLLSANHSTDGEKSLREYLTNADVVLVGVSQALQEQLGIEYAQLSAINPTAVWCQLSGWGRDGPERNMPATELLVQAVAGTMRYFGKSDSEPVRLGFDAVSVSTGMAAVQAVLAALFWRNSSGQGQRVDVSMLGTGIAINQWATVAESTGKDAVSRQLHGPRWEPDHGFACREGRCLIGFFHNREKSWLELVARIGRNELQSDPQFLHAIATHHGLIPPFIEQSLSTWSIVDLERLVREEMGGTVVPILNIPSMLDHEQTKSLGVTQREGNGIYLRVPFLASEGLSVYD